MSDTRAAPQAANGIQTVYLAGEFALDTNIDLQNKFNELGTVFAAKATKLQDWNFKAPSDPNFPVFIEPGMPQVRPQSNLWMLQDWLKRMGHTLQPHQMQEKITEISIMNTVIGNKTTQAQKDFSTNAETGTTIAQNSAALIKLLETMQGVLSTSGQLQRR